jgi:hypothetical protein
MRSLTSLLVSRGRGRYESSGPEPGMPGQDRQSVKRPSIAAAKNGKLDERKDGDQQGGDTGSESSSHEN